MKSLISYIDMVHNFFKILEERCKYDALLFNIFVQVNIKMKIMCI